MIGSIAGRNPSDVCSLTLARAFENSYKVPTRKTRGVIYLVFGRARARTGNAYENVLCKCV